FDFWGQGTIVTVSSAPKVAPKLFPLFSPCCGDGASIVLGCLAQGFFPVPVDMTWDYSGSEGPVRDYLPATLSENSYIQVSALDLNATKCPKSKYQCNVKHYDTSENLVVPCKDPCPCKCPCDTPSVSLSSPSLESLLLGTGANLTCTLSGVKNGNGATFTWTHTPGEASTLKPIQGTPKKDSSGTYSVSSVLEICAEEWTRGDTFSCTVSHPEIETTTKTISKPPVIQIPPQVYLLPPSVDELALNELVSITCLVRGHSPKEALVQWLKGSETLPREDYIINDPQPEPRGTNTFIISSILQVSASEWKAENKYSCVVGHEALPLNFTQQTIDRFSGKPTNVNVSVILSDVYGTCY
ncbi:immunoglobulin alpha-2 heavy chain-like, partial [Notamacropus eugenii]|uniref:immunoglobulin alpha-2 heavy chain-like n=1 Tax=Notamacropus eugenii TaxID=9315 RepID=UPI003B67CC48